jgi:inhibitor of cysteine peptidase
MYKDMLVITHKHHKHEFKIILGEKFKVELPENPSAGYLWIISQSTSPNITLINKEFILPRKDHQMIGQAGLRVFMFEATETGSASLELILKRPWEKEDKFADKFSIKLSVEEN